MEEESQDWRELSFTHKKWLAMFRKELKSMGKTAMHKMDDGTEKSHFQFMEDELKTAFKKQHADIKANGLIKDVLAMEKVYEKALKALDSLGAPRVKKTFMAREKPTRGRGRGRGRGASASRPKSTEIDYDEEEDEEQNEPLEEEPKKPTKSPTRGRGRGGSTRGRQKKQIEESKDEFEDDSSFQ